jgi:hypothetical protein
MKTEIQSTHRGAVKPGRLSISLPRRQLQEGEKDTAAIEG